MIRQKIVLFIWLLAVAICFVLVFGFISTADAAPPLNINILLKSGSRIDIRGDSTLHTYEATTSQFILEASAQLSQDIVKNAINKQYLLKNIILMPVARSFILTIPVTTLQSSIPGLTPKIHQTMNQKEFPNIVFKMSGYEVITGTLQNDTFLIRAKGVLMIAKRDREITLDLMVKSSENNIRVIGETQIIMTDYGIRPPTFLFLKVASEVLIKWDLLLDAEEVKQASNE